MSALALAFLLAADPQPKQPPPPATLKPSAEATTPGTPKAHAEEFVAAMVKNDFQAATKHFDANVTKALSSPDKVRAIWETITKQAGAYEKTTGSRTEVSGDHLIVFVGVKFAKGPLEMRLTMDKAGKIAGIAVGPPPVPYTYPPYVNRDAYEETAVVVGKGTEWELPGTLSKPKGMGPFAGVVLLQGSGPQDRDETIRANKPFKDLAGGLATRGVAVLRFDKRTLVYGAKLQKVPITIDDEVTNDARAAIALLRKTPGIDPTKVYVVGHSLGAMLAPKIASLEPNLAGFVAMAGGTRPLEDIILDQFEFLTSLQGGNEQAKAQLAKIKEQVARAKSSGLSTTTPTSELPLGAPASYWLSLRGYSPTTTAEKLSCRMLILHGDRDYQVTQADYAGWEKSLFSKPSALLKRFPDLNHLFMKGQGKATPAEYEKQGHVAEEVIDTIANWAK